MHITANRQDDRSVGRAGSRLRAASALIRVGVFEEALSIVEGAIAEARADGDQRTLALALLTQAQALALSGEGDPHALIDQAQTIARATSDGPLLAQAALVRVGSGVPEDKTAALVELTEPLELLAADAPERVDLLCAAAVIVTFIDGSPAAERLLDAARLSYESTGSLRCEAIWLAARSIVAGVARCRDRVGARDGEQVLLGRPERGRSDGDGGGHPGAAPRRVHARQLAGGRRTASRARTGGRSRTSTVRRRQGLALQDDERDRAAASSTAVQQLIDVTMREGARYRTFNAEVAATVQQLLVLFERDEVGLLADLVRLRAKERGPGVWHAVLALCERTDDEAPLIDRAAGPGRRLVLAVRRACRRGRCAARRPGDRALVRVPARRAR